VTGSPDLPLRGNVMQQQPSGKEQEYKGGSGEGSKPRQREFCVPSQHGMSYHCSGGKATHNPLPVAVLLKVHVISCQVALGTLGCLFSVLRLCSNCLEDDSKDKPSQYQVREVQIH
jgi:hypothetical protein